MTQPAPAAKPPRTDCASRATLRATGGLRRGLGALVLFALVGALGACAAPMQYQGDIVVDQAGFARRFAAMCELTGGAEACFGDPGWR